MHISAQKPRRVRNEGPTIFLLAKRRDLLGGEIKIGLGGVAKLSKSEALAHDPLVYYHHVGHITEGQRQAGERYAELHWKLYGKELKSPSIYDRMVTDEENRPRSAPPIQCETFCGRHCDCGAADWMENQAEFCQADMHLMRHGLYKDRIILRRVTIDQWWPEREQDVVRLKRSLELLRTKWRM